MLISDQTRVIIAGGRNFADYDLLEKNVDLILENKKQPIIIVSGGARGADTLGELYAAQRHIKSNCFPADWETYGKRAGFIRNEKMAENADILIAFWDGTSKGTKHMINIAEQRGLEVHIIYYR